jgi:alginate O-acetyltransferase complex protein AlgI
MPSILMKSNRTYTDIVAKGKLFPTFDELWRMALTFALTVLSLAIFRSSDIVNAFYFIGRIFSPSILVKPTGEMFMGGGVNIVFLLVVITIFMLTEWLGRENKFAIETTGDRKPRPVRWVFYLVIVMLTFYMTGVPQQFVYFQF